MRPGRLMRVIGQLFRRLRAKRFVAAQDVFEQGVSMQVCRASRHLFTLRWGKALGHKRVKHDVPAKSS